VDGAQHVLDGGGVEAGFVQQDHSLSAQFAGDGLADGGPGSLQDLQLVRGEEVSVSREEKVGFGECSESGSGEGCVGFPQGRLVIGVGSAGFSQGSCDVAKVSVEDVGEEAVQIGKMPSDMGGGSSYGQREGGHRDCVAAVDGHQRLAEIHDPGSLLVLAVGKLVPASVDSGDAVSHQADGGSHGGALLGFRSTWAT
jgi:hypothetical protein